MPKRWVLLVSCSGKYSSAANHSVVNDLQTIYLLLEILADTFVLAGFVECDFEGLTLHFHNLSKTKIGSYV